MPDTCKQLESMNLSHSVFKDACALIRETARPQFLTNPVHGYTSLVSAGGAIINTFYPPRRFVAHSISGFCSAFKGFAERETSLGLHATVAIGETAILAKFIVQSVEEQPTLAQVSLSKSTSACLAWLSDRVPGREPKYQDQKSLIRHLRTLFPGRHNKQFATDLSNLKFKSDGEVNSNVQHGRETVSKSVEQKIAGNAGDLPDEITLLTTVNDLMPSLDPEWSHPVECVLHINMEEGKFAVIPKAGQIEAAVAAANAKIAAAIEKELFDFVPADKLNLRILRDCAFG